MAKGFAGIAYIPYTGWSIKGQQFNGTVQVTVHPDGALGGLAPAYAVDYAKGVKVIHGGFSLGGVAVQVVEVCR